MTKKEFYKKLDQYEKLNFWSRHGQAAFNLMQSLYPEKVRPYIGTKYDPYYRDDKVEIFVTKILGGKND